jgi:hypothetical protein
MTHGTGPVQPLDLAARDYEIYRIAMDLWSRENPIKTNKLQVLLVVNGLLVSAITCPGAGSPSKNGRSTRPGLSSA